MLILPGLPIGAPGLLFSNGTETQPMTSSINPSELRELAGRLQAASASLKLPRPVRTDLRLAARVLGAIAATIELPE